MYSGGWSGLISLREISKDSVLAGLKVTSQVSAQSEFFSRSALRSSADLKGLSTIMLRIVSSANKRMLEPISLTISLIKTKNRRGPRIEP